MGRGGTDSQAAAGARELLLSDEFDLTLVRRFTLIRMDSPEDDPDSGDPPESAPPRSETPDCYVAFIEMKPGVGSVEWYVALEKALNTAGKSWPNMINYETPDDDTVWIYLRGKSVEAVEIEVRGKVVELDLQPYEDFEVNEHWWN